jgi:hypothetical protein
MKSIKNHLLIAALLFSSVSFAQSNKEDVDIIQASYGKSKKELINEYMKLTEPKAGPFWKLYDEYEVERKALGREKIRLIEDYVKHLDSLSDVKADELMKSVIENNLNMEKLYKKYYEKFSATLGGVKAAKFMQMEVYLQTVVRNVVQEEIPFIHDMDEKKK